MWTGEGSNEAEQELAVGMAAVVSPDRAAEKISEGAEPDEFWAAIGGKGDYSKEVNLNRQVDELVLHCHTRCSSARERGFG